MEMKDAVNRRLNNIMKMENDQLILSRKSQDSSSNIEDGFGSYT